MKSPGLKFFFVFAWIFFFVSCEDNGTKVRLEEAWLSLFFNQNGDHTFIVIDEDSSGVYYSPTPSGNCYDSESLTITGGLVQVDDRSYTYIINENNLTLNEIVDYDTTIFGYPIPEQFTKANDIEIKRCN